MIGFACPGCGRTGQLPDERGGTEATCPSCSTRFLVPDAPFSAPPPLPVPQPPPPVPPPLPPPTPQAAPGTVEIAPCPGCSIRLSVETQDVGKQIACPRCNTVYDAIAPGSAVPPPPAARRSSRNTFDDDRPSRSNRNTFDDDRPSRSSRRRDDDERPSRRRDEFVDEADEYDYRRRRGSGGDLVMGILSLVFGLISILMICCCVYISPVFSIISIVLGILSLKTPAKVPGIIGIALAAVGILLVIANTIFVFLVIAANPGPGGPFGPPGGPAPGPFKR